MSHVYTPDMPVASHLPSADQPVMNANSQYLKDFGSKDHQFTLNSANAYDGFHNQVTFNANESAPAFSPGVSVLYPNTGNGQSQLCFKNAAVDVQLTTVKASVPTISGNGCSFIPGTPAGGGLLIQWGSGTSGVAVTFPVAFTNAVFSPRVTVTAVGPTASTTTPPVISTGPSTTGFTCGNNGGQAFTFHWMAIGQA